MSELNHLSPPPRHNTQPTLSVDEFGPPPGRVSGTLIGPDYQMPLSYEAPRRARRLRGKLAATALVASTLVGSLTGAKLLASDHDPSPVGGNNDPTGQLEPKVLDQYSTEHMDETQLEQQVLVQPTFTAPILQEKTKDLNQDPAFRAASLTLFGKTANGGVLIGSGGLAERDGKLEITSIGHVTKDAPKLGVETLYANVPGVGVIELGQPTKGLGLATDEISAYDLNENQQALMKLKAKNGVIAPLKETTAAPKLGDKFLITNPTSGENIEVSYLNIQQRQGDFDINAAMVGEGMFVVTKYEDQDLYTDGVVSAKEIYDLQQHLKASADTLSEVDMVCEGFSGSPLRPSEQTDTMVGSLSVGVPLVQKNGMGCGEIIGVRLNSEQ